MDATATPHSAAAALLEFMAELPLLLPADKKAVLKLLQGLDPSGFDLIARSGHGISVFRTAACSSSNTDIYRVTGMGEVEAEGRPVFELLCNLSLIPEWDVLFKSGRYLSFAADPAGRCEVAYLHIVYGLPGVSNLVSDRDFVLRAVRVFFPKGMCVLSVHSVGPEEEVAGDPGPAPRMIRGHMWHSGYVVVPSSSGCCISVTLQVDPKGWIPTTVKNLSLEAIPLNIQRVRGAVARLGPAVMAALPEYNRQQGAQCRKRPPVEALGRLPPGWLAPGAGAAAVATGVAGAGVRSGGNGGVGRVGGVGVQQQGWGVPHGGGGSSCSLNDSSSACSYGSGCSLPGGSEEVEEVDSWHDAGAG